MEITEENKIDRFTRVTEPGEYRRVPISVAYLSENDLLLRALRMFWPDANLLSGSATGIGFTTEGLYEWLEWDENFMFTLDQLLMLGFAKQPL